MVAFLTPFDLGSHPRHFRAATTRHHDVSHLVLLVSSLGAIGQNFPDANLAESSHTNAAFFPKARSYLIRDVMDQKMAVDRTIQSIKNSYLCIE